MDSMGVVQLGTEHGGLIEHVSVPSNESPDGLSSADVRRDARVQLAPANPVLGQNTPVNIPDANLHRQEALRSDVCKLFFGFG